MAPLAMILILIGFGALAAHEDAKDRVKQYERRRVNEAIKTCETDKTSQCIVKNIRLNQIIDDLVGE